MSIYSGFATRKDESNYNQLLVHLLQLLQSHLLQFVTYDNFSKNKAICYTRLFSKMQKYEQHKYLPPKFSEILKPVANLIRFEQNTVQTNRLLNNSCIESDHEHQKIEASSHQPNKIRISKDQKACHIKQKAATQRQERSFEYSSDKQKKKENGRQIKVYLTDLKRKKYHQSFYELQQEKKHHTNQRYGNFKGKKQNGSKLRYKSQTESPANILSTMQASRRNPIQSYAIANEKLLNQSLIKIGTPHNKIIKQEKEVMWDERLLGQF